ncbi:S9 family peptidase [Microbacterium sp. SS28]|uniref:alpha/beta hydrolase family protein n=1 Tax=Microbacterium sp. SS28 TaxID=2919948 RepID=UPI001FA99B13|nr:alpha/beta fold hydrolase [Microbacterium sp. SS28]
MNPVIIVLAALATVVLPFAWFIQTLALRVVGTVPRRKVILVRRVGEAVELPESPLTTVPGNYGLWFGENFEHHALVGPIERSDGHRVVRRVLHATAPIPSEPFEAQWTGHLMSGPAEIASNWEDVSVPLQDGTDAPAWLFRTADPGRPWVIHVQGIRTTRLVALRSVEAAQDAQLTSLVITYRGAGDGPAAAVSQLGQREWSDLADAIAYARSHGASKVYVVAWSMGAGIALELLRHQPKAIDRLALVAPATNWRGIVQQGVKRAGLPTFLARVVIWVLESPAASKIVGMPSPLKFDQLNWTHNFTLSVPTLVIHSPGDEEIPFELTQEFARTNPSARVVETARAQHGWEANADPEHFGPALTAWLGSPSQSSPQ